MSERQREDSREYEELFIRFADRVEMWIRRAVWIGLCLLIVAQLLLAVPEVRVRAVKVDRLEGVPYERYGAVKGP